MLCASPNRGEFCHFRAMVRVSRVGVSVRITVGVGIPIPEDKYSTMPTPQPIRTVHVACDVYTAFI